MKDIEKNLRDISNPRAAGMRKVQEAADAFEKWDPMGAKDGKTKSAPSGPASRAEAEAALAAKPDADPAPATAAPEEAPAQPAGQPDKTA